MLLAQQVGGRVLHPGPQALLPRLLAVRPPPPGPSQRHPGPLHRRAHPGHPADDGPGGVEEQTQRGDGLEMGQEAFPHHPPPPHMIHLCLRALNLIRPLNDQRISSVFTGNHKVRLEARENLEQALTAPPRPPDPHEESSQLRWSRETRPTEKNKRIERGKSQTTEEEIKAEISRRTPLRSRGLEPSSDLCFRSSACVGNVSFLIFLNALVPL